MKTERTEYERGRDLKIQSGELCFICRKNSRGTGRTAKGAQRKSCDRCYQRLVQNVGGFKCQAVQIEK